MSSFYPQVLNHFLHRFVGLLTESNTVIWGFQHPADSVPVIACTVGNKVDLGPNRDALASPGHAWQHSKDYGL